MLHLLGEYKDIERQVSEPRNQASNGEAQRMHHIVMNMVRGIILPVDCH